MICRLCLQNFQELIHIFDVVGLELNVAMVLGKYFWFEPKSDDPISTSICYDCWTQVSSFHEFYLNVEEAHRLLTESFSMKTEEETYSRERQATDNTVTKSLGVELSTAETFSEVSVQERYSKTLQEVAIKAAADDDTNEKEIKFSSLLYDDDGLMKASVNDEKNQLSAENNASAAVEESTQEQKYYNDETSFHEEYFVEKVLERVQSLEEEEDKLIIKEEPLQTNELRRSIAKSIYNLSIYNKARSNDENCLTQKCLQQKEQIADLIKKLDVSVELNLPMSQGDRELKSDAIDDKIAGYMRLLCHICSEELPTFARLSSHVTKQHEKNAYAICCNKKFYKRILLVEHIDWHFNPECYKCLECNKVFGEKQYLRKHMMRHQPNELKTFACEHCSKKFAKHHLLEQHLIVHGERNHICEVCQRRFPCARQLKCHIKKAHTKGSSYSTKCHICDKLIRGRPAFERHQLEHTGIKLPKVQCEKCGSLHKNKDSLQKHRRRHNEEGTLHVCHICRKVSPNRSALLSHYRYAHVERTFKCSLCKKAFRKPLDLKKHMNKHTGDAHRNETSA